MFLVQKSVTPALSHCGGISSLNFNCTLRSEHLSIDFILILSIFPWKCLILSVECVTAFLSPSMIIEGIWPGCIKKLSSAAGVIVLIPPKKILTSMQQCSMTPFADVPFVLESFKEKTWGITSSGFIFLKKKIQRKKFGESQRRKGRHRVDATSA